MSLARSGKYTMLTHPLSHELRKKLLSGIPPKPFQGIYIKKYNIIKHLRGSFGYRPPTEVGNVS